MSISSHLFGKAPIVTFLLAAVMAGSFGYLTMYVDRSGDEVDVALDRTRSFYEQNPGVHVSDRDRSLLGPVFVDVIAEAHQKAVDSSSAPVFSERMKARSQKRFDGLAQAAFEERMDAFPAWRHGVASQGSPPQNFLTYAFVHDSVKALVVSLIFFVLAGIGLEAAYGSLLFGVLCLLGVLAPAVAFQTLGPAGIPLSGASGLLSVVLGAYWVRGMGGRFAIPGWLVLPAWMFVETLIVRGIWIDSYQSAPIVAHLVGLGLGVTAGIVLRAANVESAIVELSDSGNETGRHPALSKAAAAIAQNNPAVALEALREGFESAPANEEIALAYWDLSKENGQAAAAHGAILPVIRDRVRKGAIAEALDHWNQLVVLVHDVVVEPTLAVRIGEALLDEGHPAAALETMERAIGSDQPLGSALAQRIIRVARDLDEGLTQRAATIALEDPHLDPASRVELESLAAVIRATSPRLPSETTMAVPLAEADDTATAVAESSGAHETTHYPVESDIDLDNTEDLMAEDVYDELSLGSAPDGSTVEADPEEVDPNALSIHSLQEQFAGDVGLEGTPDKMDPDTAEWNVPGRVGDLSAEPETAAPALLEPDDAATAYMDVSHLEAGALSGDSLTAEASAQPPDLTLSAADETTEDLDIGLGLRTIKCVEGVPVGVKETAIEVEIDGRGASKVPFERIDAVAVAAVGGLSQKPVLVIDLVLNWMSGEEEPLKVIRLCSNRFNPVRVMSSADTPVAALRSLVALVLEKGGGIALPDQGVLGGGAFASFPDLATYQREVLCAEE